MVKLLVVDDEEDVCMFVKAFFEQRRMTVFTAGNGIEALQVIEANRPNIVIIDIQMPKMDGMTLLENIKDKCKDMDIIMVSGVGDMEVIEKAKKLGAQEYITKPLVLEELEKVVLAKAIKWTKDQKRT